MTEHSLSPFPLAAALHFAIQIALVGRVLLRSHREPASRIAWVVVILVMPVAAWPRGRRLWNNAIAMIGPVL